MSVNLKQKTALVYDFGLFTEQASRLSRDFGKVWYFVPWQSAFPKTNKALIGENFDGLERVLDFWDYADKADVIVCFDTHTGDLVEFLRSKGYRVFGAGRGEALELERWKARKFQDSIGLPTQYTVRIRGLEKLREYLKTAKNKFIKLNIFRGDIETFRHIDYESSQPLLDHLAYELGPKQEELEFVIENIIEGVEPGIDSIVVDGAYLSPTMYGYELKGAGYLGRVVDYDSLPDPIKKVNDKLSPFFKKLKTRSFFSTELIVDKNGKGFLIDPTVRCAAPTVSAIQTELIENWSEIIWNASEGKATKPIMKYKYAGGVALESEWAKDHWLVVKFPKEMRRWIKFRTAAKFNDVYYAVPGFTSICSLIALGNSPDEIIKTLKERAEEVKAYQIEKNLSGLGEIKLEIEKGRKFGVAF